MAPGPRLGAVPRPFRIGCTPVPASSVAMRCGSPSEPARTLARMFERLADLETELEKLESQLPEIYASGDQAAARTAGRRHAELKPVVDAYRAYTRSRRASWPTPARCSTVESDARDARVPRRRDRRRKRPSSSSSTPGCASCSCPRDPNDGKNVIVEIRGGEGGEEAQPLGRRSLPACTSATPSIHRWKFEVLNRQPSDMGGLREITFVVKGDDAWSRLKHEAGPHRVQRVPVTESQGRVHTERGDGRGAARSRGGRRRRSTPTTSRSTSTGRAGRAVSR